VIAVSSVGAAFFFPPAQRRKWNRSGAMYTAGDILGVFAISRELLL
jgi:hypothetical protein